MSDGHGDFTKPADFAEQLIDEVLGEEFDWRGKVRAYPVAALTLAAAAGFAIGSQRGQMIVGAVGGWATEELARNLGQIWGGGAS
ncbi:MAG: hypothetical protein AAGD38_12125 [Acidobacteriota bacterium]